ncbi:MAG: lysophospholipid acyltransferase family protein [Candidatus Eisenbacteria sp.]|nr:lysophospholipid acyltransferase family protein [Candidatus Eisenbacteria bacterium]
MDSWERKARWIGRGGSALVGGLGATWRARVLGGEHLAACRSRGGFIHAFWHGQLLPLVYLKRNQGIVVLVSQNRDGEYITQVIHRKGFRTVRGSTSRGGFRSLIEMVRLGRQGAELAITPDGPRGPRHAAQAGLLLVAQRARVPVLPMAVAAWPCRRLSSWDRFLIPLPFARTVIVYGPALEIPPDLPTDALLAEWTPRVNAALMEVTHAAEEAVRAWAGRDSAAGGG